MCSYSFQLGHSFYQWGFYSWFGSQNIVRNQQHFSCPLWFQLLKQTLRVLSWKKDQKSLSHEKLKFPSLGALKFNKSLNLERSTRNQCREILGRNFISRKLISENARSYSIRDNFFPNCGDSTPTVLFLCEIYILPPKPLAAHLLSFCNLRTLLSVDM